MVDISVYENLESYLMEKGVINKEEPYSMHYCKGGVSCTVCFVYSGDKQLIVKQGLEQLKVKETWLCDPNRMNTEQESNRIYHNLMPDCAPRVYDYDDENCIYWREAVPESWDMWKTDLMAGKLNFNSASKVITTLAIVHNHCAENPEVREKFKDKDIFYHLRVSPYIEFILQKHPQLNDFAQPIIRLLMDSEITLIHGDFSPKNIMTDSDKISIMDYEVAHYGHPAFDLAFFSNHFILKAIKNKAWAASYLNMMEYMMDIYFSTVNFMPADELEKAYIQLLSLLMIARVDGKSPAEYIIEESDKQLVRDCAFAIVDNGVESYKAVAKLILNKIKEHQGV